MKPYTISTIQKLGLTILVSTLLASAFITLSGIFLLNLPAFLSFLVGLFPALTVVYAVVAHFREAGNKRMLASLKHVAVNLKYNPFFPFYFYYEPDPPKKYKFKLPEGRLPDLKKGDVLLRRMENAVVGLIFEQNSYYTHAAICVEENGTMMVYEAVSSGVRSVSIEDFIKCDDLVVLRPVYEQLYYGSTKIIPDFIDKNNINTDGIENFNKLLKLRGLIKDITNVREGVFDSNPERTENLRAHMEEMYEKAQPCNEWHKKQGALYDKLLRIHNADMQSITPYHSNDKFIEIACGLAKCLKGTPYDYTFDFTDFKKLSCVEYVWLCYWGVYPVHRIHRKTYKYFSWIEVLVLVPDLFLKSNFFESVYPSNEKKEELPKLNYWKFLVKQFLCLLVLLVIVAAIYFVTVNILSS